MSGAERKSSMLVNRSSERDFLPLAYNRGLPQDRQPPITTKARDRGGGNARGSRDSCRSLSSLIRWKHPAFIPPSAEGSRRCNG